MNYSIPCRHETEGVPVDQQIPDYHPLTKVQIKDLLMTAINSTDWKVKNSIHCRLSQAIVGTMCPSNIDERSCKLDSTVTKLYLDFVRGVSGYATDDLVEKLYEVMNGRL
jgi:hypothetical protein